MTRKLPLLIVRLLLVAALSSEVSADGLVNEDVKRNLDLSTHLAKITTEIVLSNQGQSSVHSFVLAVEADLAPHLAYIGASVSPISERNTANNAADCQPASQPAS